MSGLSTEYSYKYVPTMKRFSEDDAPIRVVVGPFGSGKSAGCVIECVKRAMEQKPGPDGVRRIRAGVVRNSYPQLLGTTMKTFFDWVKPGIHGQYKVAEKTFAMRMDDVNGAPVEAEFCFKALDDAQDVRDLLSLEYTFVWFNEVREITKSIFDAMDGRIGRYPKIIDGGATWYGMICDTNPPDTDHWLYKLLEEESPIFPPDHPYRAGEIRVSKFHQASGMATHPDGIWGVPTPGVHAENLPYLRKGYYHDLAAGKDQDFIDVYVHGKYGYVKDGKPVYSNWNPATHVAPSPIKIIPSFPLILGWDFGVQFSACVIAQQLPNGRVNIKHEFVPDNIGARRFAREIVKPFIFATYLGMDVIGTGDLTGGSRSSANEEITCMKELADAGLPAIPSQTNDWQSRFSSVDSLLTAQINVNGKMEPKLQVDPECKILTKGFNGEYKFLRVYNAKRESYKNEPDKNKFSHPHDSVQYIGMFLESGLKRYRKQHTGAVSSAPPLPASAWS
jgi:hypothetical protein